MLNLELTFKIKQYFYLLIVFLIINAFLLKRIHNTLHYLKVINN